MSATTYSLEHAKSARSKCKKCKDPIVKGDIRLGVTIPADPEKEGSYAMSSYYHVGCFVLPRRLKHLGAQEFVQEHVTDISEDTSILPDRMNEIVAQIEQVAPKKKVEEEETFMTRIAAAAKEQLEAEEGKPPASKKAKKETKKTKKAEEEEFREMVELYQDHHKTKGDTLKDFLRWNKQTLTGKKDFVLFKVMDGHVHGRLGRCPLDGGRLKFKEGDYDTVHCDGGFDEESQVRMPCAFTGTRTDPSLRSKWFTYEPSEEEQEEMTKEKEAALGTDSSAVEMSEAGKELITAAEKYEWDFDSPAGIKVAAAQLVDLTEGKVDLPEGRDPKRLLGQVLVANKEKGINGVVEEIVSKYGFKEAKDAKKAAKHDAIEKICANPKNADLLMAFTELSEYYFKDGNTNAGLSYKKVIAVLKDFEVEVTAENAMSFSKGKTKVAGIGKGSAEKMKEFRATGTMEKLEEKRAAHS